MLFNSLEFLFFLPLVFAIYWSLKSKEFQNSFLLLSSYVFYGAWDWRFLVLIIFSSFVDFWAAKMIHFTDDARRKKLLLAISVLTNLGILFTFKYFNFFVDSFSELTALFGLNSSYPTINIVLPVGISFYTFQSMSYTIDVYRKEVRPTTNWVNFFAYVAFFPQLVAGPIERASSLLPQLQTIRKFDRYKAVIGMRQILWGFFKKVVIADNLSIFVDLIFSNYESIGGMILVVGAILFAFQIYCDFSGYSDIAIGCAGLFGIRLRQNFSTPYFSRDIGEFWRRWHISLSTWFRDYVYIPLGGSKVSKSIHIRNILAVFLLSGLWHGANWTFLMWGFIHASLYIFIFILGGKKVLFNKYEYSDAPKILLTFLVTTLAWVFFRSESIHDAFYFIQRMFSNVGHSAIARELSIQMVNGIIAISSIILMMSVEWINRDYSFGLKRLPKSKLIRCTMYLALLFMIMEYFNEEKAFIYFQF